jgi:hypothetical protein
MQTRTQKKTILNQSSRSYNQYVTLLSPRYIKEQVDKDKLEVLRKKNFRKTYENVSFLSRNNN